MVNMKGNPSKCRKSMLLMPYLIPLEISISTSGIMGGVLLLISFMLVFTLNISYLNFYNREST